MLRKSILAVAATALLAAGALAVTPDLAFAKKNGGGGHHHRHHHHRHHHLRVFSPPVYAGYDTCLRKRWVATPYGMRLRWVNVCAY